MTRSDEFCDEIWYEWLEYTFDEASPTTFVSIGLRPVCDKRVTDMTGLKYSIEQFVAELA